MREFFNWKRKNHLLHQRCNQLEKKQLKIFFTNFQFTLRT